MFTKDSRRKDGLNPYCRTCTRTRNRAHYEANRESESARKHKFYEANRERLRARNREWHETNREMVRAQVAEYYKRNRASIREQHRIWHQANPDNARNRYLLRRARKQRNGIYYVPLRFLQRLYASPCAYCGSARNIQADHVMPIARGGVHSIGNLLPACRDCNLSKHDKTVMEWRLQQMRKPA